MDHTTFAVLQDKSSTWLEEEERRVAAHLLDVRKQRNLRCPALRLLPELLLQVFRYVQQIPLLIYTVYNTDWIVVTHICKYWREVALNCQNLWSYIILFSEPYIAAFLERAGYTSDRKGAPLSLRWDAEDQGPASLNLLKPFADSLARVDITLQLEDSSHLEQLLQNTWNNVQELFLATPDDAEEWKFLDFGALNRSLPPRLRSLGLFGVVPLTWACGPMYCDLQSLSIDRLSPSDKHLPTWEQLLDILESCPSLRTLMLRDADPPASPRPLSRQTILLPNLTYVELGFNLPSNIAYLLSHLHIPEGAKIDIETEESIDPEFGILSCLPQDLSNLKLLQSISQVEMVISKQGLINANCKGGEKADALFLWVNSWDLPLFFRATVLQLHNLCQFSAVESIHISVHASHLHPVSSDNWHQIFSSLTSLKYLTYSNSQPQGPNSITPPDFESSPFRAILRALTWCHN